MKSTMLLCQISDVHIRAPGQLAYGRVDTARLLQNAVKQIMASAPLPDAVVITGDLTDFGRPAEYEHLRELIAPFTMPVFLMPGNHDDRENLRDAFPEHTYLQTGTPTIDYVVEDFPLRIVALDSVIPGESGGRLAAESVAWLESTLAAAPAWPTVVLIHHPPFPTLIAHMDAIGLANPEDLEAVIVRHHQVERVLCGHLHRTIVARFAGTVASTAPSPAHQVALDLSDDGLSQFVMEPPGYQIHAFIEGTGLISHTAVIGTFPGPYPFHDAEGLID